MQFQVGTMRDLFIIVASILVACSTTRGQIAPAPGPTAAEIAARMLRHDMQRQTASGGYSGIRQYAVENRRFGRHASMEVHVACDAEGAERFRIASEEGWESANEHVLPRILEEEAKASRPSEQSRSRISPDNYTFQKVGTELLDGQPAYVIDLFPKRRDQLLFRGRIWVDASDYALARVEGQTANPSFWVRNVHFTWQARKSDGYWFPVSTKAVIDIRILGQVEVSIRYLDYLPNVKPDSKTGFPVLAEMTAGRP